MKTRIQKLLLWLWPFIERLYAGLGIKVRLDQASSTQGAVTQPAVSGAHMHSAANRGGIPGAHAWVLAAIALASMLFLPVAGKAQQGGQTSSTPPLTGTSAPSGNCGVGSLYVNTTTGDLYDCNAGAWNKVNGGGSGAFSGGLGTSYQDAGGIAAPANPASGNARLFFNSGTSLLACLTSTGANCMPAGGAGTVTQVTSGNFSPLFNVSVATNTTTPAFSFATINQSANTVYGNCTGSTGAPAFCALTTGMMPTGFCNTTGGTSGQVYESNGSGCGSYQDPIVSGPDAPGAAPTKNPVQMGLYDGTNVQRVLGSTAGRLSVDINSAPSIAVTGTFWQATQPVSLSGNQAVNVAQVAGNTTSTAASGTQLVGIADGSGNKYAADPCQQQVPTALAINEATASLTTIITGTSAKKTYICSINLVSAAAQNVNLVAGTGTNCGTTVHVGFFGGTTAATGWNLAANGGVAQGGGGYHIAGGTDTAADNICYTSSGASQVSGSLTYVQQ